MTRRFVAFIWYIYQEMYVKAIRTCCSGSDVTERWASCNRVVRYVMSGSRVVEEVAPASRRGNRHPAPSNNGTKYLSCFFLIASLLYLCLLLSDIFLFACLSVSSDSCGFLLSSPFPSFGFCFVPSFMCILHFYSILLRFSFFLRVNCFIYLQARTAQSP